MWMPKTIHERSSQKCCMFAEDEGQFCLILHWNILFYAVLDESHLLWKGGREIKVKKSGVAETLLTSSLSGLIDSND